MTREYKGYTYDPSKDYFGPNGSWLSRFIPDYPPTLDDAPGNVRELIKESFNRDAAFPHDVDYTGKKASGLWGRIKDALERRKADKRFHCSMIRSIMLYSDFLTREQIEECLYFSDAAYRVVRGLGWIFYKKSDTLT